MASTRPTTALDIPPELQSITHAIQAAGGTPLFVGGFVRDHVLGLDAKDIDIEVYELTADTLTSVLSAFGKVDTVGASFGVIKLTTLDNEYDVTLPRRENKTGHGHRGFTVEPDPTMTPEDAAKRRDFTLNAMALTPGGHLLDFFGGLRDLHARTLRHASERFSEDPLRVLRGMQFAGRFDLRMDAHTAYLARTLKPEFSTLARERVWGEFEKWATKSVRPSAGLEVLRQTGWVALFPELDQMIGIPQDPEWHPEGDVWSHTKHVCDSAAHIAQREALDADDRLVLLLAALCHDLGKATTTRRAGGRWRSPRHAQEGVPITEAFLSRLGAPRAVIERVTPLVAEHMAHLNDATPRSVRRLAVRTAPSSLRMLGHVIEADHSGRPPLAQGMPEGARAILEVAQDLRVEAQKPQPLILGRHLLAWANQGHLPDRFRRGGPHFRPLLDLLFEHQLDGDVHDEQSGLEHAIALLDQGRVAA